MKQFFHLVDNEPPGAILYLVRQLDRFPEHTILTSFPGEYSLKASDIEQIENTESVVVMHCTGRESGFFVEIERFFSVCKQSFVLMHVSPYFLRSKERTATLDKLHQLYEKFGTIVMATGPEMAEVYRQEGLNTIAIQPGVEVGMDEPSLGVPLSQRDIILTTCTNGSANYHHIKGIDMFADVVKICGLQSKALIVGHSSSEIHDGLARSELSHNDLQQIIRRTRAYVQLSRTEAYNLTAIEAKRHGVPIIVSDIEGHKDNARHGFKVSNTAEAATILRSIWEQPLSSNLAEIVEQNFKDSLIRETPTEFRRSIHVAAEMTSRGPR